MEEGMTNEQYKIQLEMIAKIVERSETLEEAAKQIRELAKN